MFRYAGGSMGALSSLLVQNQILSVTQIEQALQRQVILGGDLPTILLELRMLDEKLLATYMSRVVGITELDSALYDSPDLSLGELISRDTAVSCRAVPIRKDEKLVVAVTGTLSQTCIERLQVESGMMVVPNLILEFRLALLLNQMYGVPLPGRMTPLQKKLLPDFKPSQFVPEKTSFERPTTKSESSAELENEVDEKISVSVESTKKRGAEPTSRLYRSDQPIQKMVIGKEPTSEEDAEKDDESIRPPRRDTPLRIDDIAARVRLTAPPESIVPEPAALEPGAETEFVSSVPARPAVTIPPGRASDPGMPPLTRKNLKKRLLSFSEAAEMLEKAENRDELMETFFHFAHQAFDFTFLAVVHGEDAAGRLAAYRGGNFNDADFVSIQLNEGGLFEKAYKTTEYQIGPMDDMAGLNALNQLGLDVPLNATVIPVVLKRRVILLLYGDSGHHGIRARRVDRIFEFSKLVASAFERLLLARKLRKFSSVPPPPATSQGDDANEAIKVDSKTVARRKRDLSAFLNSGMGGDELRERSTDGPDEVVSASAADLESALAGSRFIPDSEKLTVHAPDVVERTLGEDAKKATVSSVPSTTLVDTDAPSDPTQPTVRISVSPGVSIRQVADHDTTLRIQVEGKATRPEATDTPHHSGIRAITPIRVGESKSRASLTDDPRPSLTDEANPTPIPESESSATADTVEAGESTQVVTTSPYARPDAASLDTPQPDEPIPSYVPRPSVADGRYMQVDREFQGQEHRERKKTAQQYVLEQDLRSSSNLGATGSSSGDTDTPPIALTKEEIRRTAGYADNILQSLAGAAGVDIDDDALKSSGEGETSSPGEHNGETGVISETRSASAEEMEGLVEAVVSGKFDEHVPERILAGGELAIKALIEHFPGPLSCDRFQELGQLSEISNHGPVLGLLMQFGNRIVSHVLPLLESFDSEIRFYATFVLYELGNREVLYQLVKRVFDNDRQIRSMAVDALKAHRDAFEYKSCVEDISMILVGATSTLEKKRIAADALAQLADPMTIEPLTTMLGSVDGILAERCQRALVKIAFRDFGFSEKRWMDWYRKHRNEHRLLWAIEGIVENNEDICRRALRVLQDEVGEQFDFPRGPLSSSQRKDLHRQLQHWWKSEGKQLFPGIPE